MEEESLEKIILTAPMGGIYNNAAQVWNHSFYWKCMRPGTGGEPAGVVADLLIKASALYGHSRRSSRRPRSERSAPAGHGWFATVMAR